jgi:hypothetical protein
MADRPDFDRLGDLLPAEGEGAAMADRPRSAPASGGLRTDLNQRLAEIWVETVGAEVAANAKPVQLRDGRLVVTTSSSAWAQTLQLMSEIVIARLNERLGDGAITRAVFRHAGWEGSPAEKPRARAVERNGAGSVPARGPSDAVEFSDEQKRALADVERLPLPPAMRATIRDAMTAGFVRARQDSGR